MKISYFLLADFASLAPQGKTNMMGIFDRILVEKFPTRLPTFYVVVRSELDFGEQQGEKNIKIIFFDQDRSKKIVLLDNDILFNRNKKQYPPSHTAILEIRDAVFDNPGTYEFVFIVDGEECRAKPLMVELISKTKE